MYFLMACSDDPLRSFRLSMALATITAAGGWAGGALFLGAFSSAIVQWVEWYACARTDSDKDNDFFFFFFLDWNYMVSSQ